jgi:hypothetical protein
MAVLTKSVGEKTRPGGESRPITQRTNVRRQVPPEYLRTHRCKKCDGQHCVGQCRF